MKSRGPGEDPQQAKHGRAERVGAIDQKVTLQLLM